MISVEKARSYKDKLINITQEIETENLNSVIQSEIMGIIKSEGLVLLLDMEYKIRKHFISVFSNISSISRMLCHSKIPQITIGTYGFGIKSRYSKRAEPVKSFSGIKRITEPPGHHDIITQLENNNLGKKAKEFEIFREIMRLYASIEKSSIILGLPGTMDINVNRAKTIRLVSHASIDLSCKPLRISVYQKTSENHNTAHGAIEEVLNIGDFYRGLDMINPINLTSKINALLIISQLDYIKEKIKEAIKPIVKTQKEIMELLDKHFAKYLIAERL